MKCTMGNCKQNSPKKEAKQQFIVQYILTHRLNQNILKNYVIIRSKSGLHDHPDQLEFKYRLRSYLMGHNEGILGGNANVQVDGTPNLEAIAYPLTGTIFRIVTVGARQLLENSNGEDEYKDLQFDGLENLAGYICHRLKEEDPTLASSADSEKTYAWVNHLREGMLSKPTEELMEAMVSCYTVFKNINENSLHISKKYISSHLIEEKNIAVNEKIKKLFFRARMFFKIRLLNNEIKEKHSNR